MTSQILPGERAATVTVVTRRLETIPGVLFLCIHNSGRSQMAAGWFRHLAGDAVRVLSAGSEPGEAVNPAAVAVMAEVGIDIEGAQPRRWTPEMMADVDVVVSMGCGDECIVVPGTRLLDWELPDPAGQGPDVVRGVRDDIEVRGRSLLDEILDREVAD